MKKEQTIDAVSVSFEFGSGQETESGIGFDGFSAGTGTAIGATIMWVKHLNLERNWRISERMRTIGRTDPRIVHIDKGFAVVPTILSGYFIRPSVHISLLKRDNLWTELDLRMLEEVYAEYGDTIDRYICGNDSLGGLFQEDVDIDCVEKLHHYGGLSDYLEMTELVKYDESVPRGVDDHKYWLHLYPGDVVYKLSTSGNLSRVLSMLMLLPHLTCTYQIITVREVGEAWDFTLKTPQFKISAHSRDHGFSEERFEWPKFGGESDGL